jgi:spermidine/putrescine transport system permease protein
MHTKSDGLSKESSASGLSKNSRRPGRFAFFCLIPVTAFIGLFFLLPAAVFLAYSFLQSSYYKVYLIPTLGNYIKVLTNPVYLKVTLNAVRIGLMTAVLSVALSYPVAYFIRFKMKKGQSTIMVLIIVSLLSSYLVRVYAWKTILGWNGMINQLLLALQLINEPLSFFLYSKGAVVITLVHVFLPFAILPILASLQNIDASVIESAKDLGASPLTAFFKVTFPLSSTGVASAFLYAFVLAAGDYVTPQLVGGTSGMMVGLSIANQFIRTGKYGEGSALSFVVLIVFISIFLLVFNSMKALKLIPKKQKRS